MALPFYYTVVGYVTCQWQIERGHGLCPERLVTGRLQFDFVFLVFIACEENVNYRL